ncbi:MAG: hypothetical protein FK730_14140 [Asgard group archaeon]|nr:hypothetical protein [Asgard group archaeon]
MIKRDIKRVVLPLVIMVCLSISPFLGQSAKAATNPPPFFTISVLAPNSNPARNQWATIMVEQLPKIGIGVDVFDHTSWAQIYPRTWDYPGPYPIPSYAEGGFDLFFVGWSWGLDWDPTGLYDSPAVTPNGDNTMQYINPLMDFAIYNYTQSFDVNDRIFWANEIQDLLYDEVPEACIEYDLNHYVYNPDLTNWCPMLWATDYQPMENWTILGESDFHYATPGDFVDFHIYQYESVYDAEWLRQIYNGLIERYESNENYGYGPRLAQSWETSDFMNYTVTLKPGVVWSDGTAFTTDDIEFSYKLQITPAFGNPDFAFWSNYVRNNSVTINSPTECVISFNKTYVFQEFNLALDIVPKHIWESVPYDQMEQRAIQWGLEDPAKFVGTGPYTLAEYDPTDAVIHLTRNDHFVDWTGITPYFDDVYFEWYSNKEGALSALAGGSIDLVSCYFSPLESDIPAGMAAELIAAPGTQTIPFNCLHPWLGTGELCPISDPDSGKYIRQAISHIIPREVICTEILEGLAAPGATPMPNVAIGWNPALLPHEYSIDIAKQKMELAGFEYPPEPTPTPTETTGIGLYVIMSILALAGASQVFILKRRK